MKKTDRLFIYNLAMLAMTWYYSHNTNSAFGRIILCVCACWFLVNSVIWAYSEREERSMIKKNIQLKIDYLEIMLEEARKQHKEATRDTDKARRLKNINKLKYTIETLKEFV